MSIIIYALRIAYILFRDKMNFTKFGDVQLLAYLFSCLGLLTYSFLFLLDAIYSNTGNDESFRVFLHGSLELVLLAQRTVNEIYHEKIGIGDYGHHFSMVLAFYLVIYVSSCKPFGWLVCHMQVLHYPMFLWYLGCRSNSYFESNKFVSSICKSLFPISWFFATGYRSTILLSSLIITIIDSQYFVFAILLPITVLMVHLDTNWTKYFMGTLGWPKWTNIPVVFTAVGILSGLLSAFIL